MGWLDLYLKFTERQESPAEFHLWAGIAALGHVLGRKVWLDRYEGGKVFPAQIMVVIVSESAVARKSAAVDLATRFLDYLPQHEVNVLPDLGSTESILGCLDRVHPDTSAKLDAVGLIVNDELGTFLSKSTYAETLLSHINKLNTNQKPIYSIKFRAWQADLHNATLGMLAATTYTGFSEEMPKAALTGGFMGRVITVSSNTPKDTPNSLTEPPPNYDRMEAKLVAGLLRMVQMRGQFRFTPEGKRWFDLWYAEHFEWCRTHTTGVLTTGWMGRKDAHLLRIAMVLAASRSSELWLDAVHLMAAKELLEQVQPNTEEVSKEVGVRDTFTRVGKRILLFLEKHGPTMHSDLIRHLHRFGDAEIIRRELETLIQMEAVVRVLVEGKPQYVRRLTRGEMWERVSVGEGEGSEAVEEPIPLRLVERD